jgi:hypothetical protein
MPSNNSGGNKKSIRGLASADERTRMRVAREGGIASGKARRKNSNS